MKSIEDKGCLNNGGGAAQEASGGSSGFMSFDFQKGNASSHHRIPPLGKPTPSKWDDAQKWLVNLSGGDKNKAKASPRNSNADDRRLVAPVEVKDYSSSEEEEEEEEEEVKGENGCPGSTGANSHCDVVTKNVDWAESIWRSSKPANSPISIVRPLCLRDMGTEMTPNASQEPSRSATPVRIGNAESMSHTSSRSSTPVRCHLLNEQGTRQNIASMSDASSRPSSALKQMGKEEPSVVNGTRKEQCKEANPLEARAAAWDEAERAKYMARYKREEVKIQAWENQQKRKAEMEFAKVEAKAERLKSRAQEKHNKKLATTRRIAEEMRATAEAKLNKKLIETCEKAEHIRRTGRVPASCCLLSFKLPSFCWPW